MFYGVLEDIDVITRSVKVTNIGKDQFFLEKLSSACLDFLYGQYDVISFYGRHAMERNVQRTAVSHGRQVYGSNRGASSHQYNPFMILAQSDATESSGQCYGASLVYSGNFSAEVEKDVRIHYGTSFGYPLSVIGSHISSVPNHQTGRVTDMHTRGVVALTGAFGYELDLGKLSQEDKQEAENTGIRTLVPSMTGMH